ALGQLQRLQRDAEQRFVERAGARHVLHIEFEPVDAVGDGHRDSLLVAGTWWWVEWSGRRCDRRVPDLRRIMARNFDTGPAGCDRAGDRATRAQVRDSPAAQAARRRAA